MPACVRRRLPLYVCHVVVYPTGWPLCSLIVGALRPPRQIRAVVCASGSFCLATIAVFVCGVEYFAPSHSECVFRYFELPLLLLQTTCSGDEPFVEVLLLQRCVRREIVRTVVFAGDRLFIQFILFGWLLGGMFVVHWFALLYGWVYMGAVVVEVGLRAALASPFRLFFWGIFLRSVPLFLVIASFGCIHHIYIVS